MEIPLKTEIGIEEAVENKTKAIKKAAWQATTDRHEKKLQGRTSNNCKTKKKGSYKMAANKGPTRQRYNKLTKELQNII